MAQKKRRRRLSLFFPFSLGLHLFIFTIVSVLYPQVKREPFSRLPLEVSLLPVISEARTPNPSILPPTMKKPIKKDEKRSIIPEAKAEGIEEKELKTPIFSQVDPTPSTTIDPKPNPSSQREEAEVIVASTQTFLPNPSPPKESNPLAKIPSLSEEVLMVQPQYAENPRPIYPQEARRKGYEGEVLLRVEVLADGRVGGIEVKRSSGYEILDRSALKAVKQWRFVPAKRGERAISQWVNIPIKFQLQ